MADEVKTEETVETPIAEVPQETPEVPVETPTKRITCVPGEPANPMLLLLASNSLFPICFIMPLLTLSLLIILFIAQKES